MPEQKSQAADSGMSERVCEQAGCRVGVESDALFHWSQGNRWEGHPNGGSRATRSDVDGRHVWVAVTGCAPEGCGGVDQSQIVRGELDV